MPRRAQLWLVKPQRLKLADFELVSTSLATWSASADVTAELVYVGPGSREELEGLDLSGKIALTAPMPAAVQRELVENRDAAGVVSFWWSPARLEYPDLVNWLDTANNREEAKSFAFVVSRRTGLLLEDMLSGGQEVVVHAFVDAELVPDSSRSSP